MTKPKNIQSGPYHSGTRSNNSAISSSAPNHNQQKAEMTAMHKR